MSYRQLHFIRRGILSISNYIFKSNYGHAVCGVLRGVALNRGLLDYFPAFVGMTVKGTWHDGRLVALPLWIADQVRNDGQLPPCGYCLEASMTGCGGCCWLAVTLTFDSSPIKGEGEYGWLFCLVSPQPLWILP